MVEMKIPLIVSSYFVGSKMVEGRALLEFDLIFFFFLFFRAAFDAGVDDDEIQCGD
jgi:hypothetical protein